MKAYRRLMLLTAALLVLIAALANGAILRQETGGSRAYRVEISRAAEVILHQGYESLDLTAYPSLIRVVPGSPGDPDFLQGGREEYALRELDGRVYRFDYRQEENRRGLLAAVNTALGAVSLLLLGGMLFVYEQILKPFRQLKQMPEELARGNLTVPLRQQKSRYFGSFLWGMDLLREKLEQQKRAEMKVQKEKKSLILSLAHDIKTPLSAIKLYARALERNLYREPEKQLEAAGKIGQRADEIERYLQQIVQSSQEDFLHLEVRQGEFYLNEIEAAITGYYEDKLELLKIPFTMAFGENCLLSGDRDRCVEILQNLMENAIKYGEGAEISISSYEESGCRILTVRNACCSLKQEELPHIFESFWRGSNSEKVAGSGLGLYICRQLACKMGGDIFAELNRGCMAVSLVLPKA